MIKTFIIRSEEEMLNLGKTLAEHLQPGDFIALIGDLGAGKSVLVRGAASCFEIEHLSSPTFTIVNEYLGEHELIHFDMYRLSSAEELFDIGWEDYLQRDAILAVEWSENVEEAFDGSEIRVHFEKLSDTVRRITVEGERIC